MEIHGSLGFLECVLLKHTYACRDARAQEAGAVGAGVSSLLLCYNSIGPAVQSPAAPRRAVGVEPSTISFYNQLSG
jgi:hypothetical protein